MSNLNALFNFEPIKLYLSSEEADFEISFDRLNQN